MKQRSFSTPAIVLNRRNIGESDRMVTLLTEKKGRVICIAKGVRKLKSSKRAYLEPGNLIKAFLIKTKSMPLLTQATLINDASASRQNLKRIRQLVQILEIFDKLFVEEELEHYIFKKALTIRQLLLKQQSPSKIKNELSALIVSLGFQDPRESKYKSISDYVAALSDRAMKSYQYLKIG